MRTPATTDSAPGIAAVGRQRAPAVVALALGLLAVAAAASALPGAAALAGDRDVAEEASPANDVDVRGGEIVFEVDGTPVGTGDAAQFAQGETLEAVRLAVVDFDNVGGHAFTTVLEGEGPADEDIGTTAEEIGEVLLTPESYDAVDAAIGMANPFGEEEDNVLLDGELTIDPDAPVGSWTLNWGVREVDLDVDPPRYGDAIVLTATHTFEVTAPAPRFGGRETVTLIGVLVVLAVLVRAVGSPRRREGLPR